MEKEKSRFEKELKELQGYVTAVKEAQEKLNKLETDATKNLIKEFERKQKIRTEGVKNSAYSAERQTEILKEFEEKDKDREEYKIREKINNYKLQIKLNRERYQQAKQFVTESSALQIEANKKQHAEELLKIGNTKKTGEEDLQSRVEINNEIIAEQARLAEALKTMDGEIDPKTKAKEDKDKATKAYKDKWSNVSTKTKEYTDVAMGALNTVFNQTTKYLDKEIAHYKEEVEKVEKEIEKAKANLEKDRSLDVKQAKSEAYYAATDESSTDEEKSAVAQELEELEQLYNLQLEMDATNAQRKENAEDANYEELKMSDEQSARFDKLSSDHAIYSDALKKKTQDEAEAQNSYTELTNKKEKLEHEIKKKEDRKKRVEFSQQIIQATVNVAQGVTSALALGPIIGPILASLVGAAGAVQIGIMSSMRDRFEDGGLLNGRLHRDGGMRIEGTNIEVEGGEYVVNRDSTRKNMGLIRYINSQRRELNGDDLHSFFSQPSHTPFFASSFAQMMEQGGEVPMMPTQVDISNSDLLGSIQNIKFEPRVAVTDIHAVQGQMAQVDEWVGM